MPKPKLTRKQVQGAGIVLTLILMIAGLFGIVPVALDLDILATADTGEVSE